MAYDDDATARIGVSLSGRIVALHAAPGDVNGADGQAQFPGGLLAGLALHRALPEGSPGGFLEPGADPLDGPGEDAPLVLQLPEGLLFSRGRQLVEHNLPVRSVVPLALGGEVAQLAADDGEQPRPACVGRSPAGTTATGPPWPASFATASTGSRPRSCSRPGAPNRGCIGAIAAGF